MPFVLAKASTLKYVTPVQHVLAVYLVGLLAVWIGMFTATSIIKWLQVFARNAALENPRVNYGRRVFDYVPKRDLAIMTFLGSFFLFAWTIVFVIAKASAVNAMPPVLHIAVLYAICLGAVICMMFTLLRGMSKVRAFARRMVGKAAPMTLLPNGPWESAQGACV